MWIFILIVCSPLIVLALFLVGMISNDVSALKEEFGGGRAFDADDDVDEAPVVSTRTNNGNYVIPNQWMEGGHYGHDGKYDDNYDRGWDTDGYPI